MTPFTPDDEVDEGALRHNIRHVRKLGTRGGGFSWGMGEFWSLTLEERKKIFEIAADEANGEWLIAAHVTHNSLKDMLRLADHAERVGFDLLIVAPPAIAAKTEAQVIEYVGMLADRTSLAIVFYNTPQFGLVMSVDGLQKICSIPNVVGVKEASFDRQLSIDAHRVLGKDAVISTPDEWIFFTGEELGFGQQVMFANTSDWRFDTPEKNYYVQFIEKATRGDIDRQFYESHLQAVKQLSDKWWGYTMKKFGGTLPVALCKYWGTLMGLRHGEVRAPLKELGSEEKSNLKTELEAVRSK
jgi:4-hydroxy-tetrahydrodipicolinate synthase